MEFNIEWLQRHEENQKQDVFYCEGCEHSPVCIISGNNKKVLISCDGEMRIFHDYYGEKRILTNYWDLLDVGIRTDQDLFKLDPDKWDYNPWFDAYDISKGYEPKNGVENFVHLDIVMDNIDEIIAAVKQYITSSE